MAGAYYHQARYAEALELYRAAGDEPQAVSGRLLCHLRLDDLEQLVAELEKLMQAAGLASDLEIENLEQLASLIAATGLKLLEMGDDLAAGRLSEAARAINPADGQSLLLEADLAERRGERQAAIAALEKALKLGVDPVAISSRLERMEAPC